MHEVSLCQRILKIVEEQAAAQSLGRVTKVCLELGALAGVEAEALRFGFDAVAKGSIVENAELEIIDVPAFARCGQCEKEVPIKQRYDACPACGGLPLEVLGGEALNVIALEAEQ